MHWQLTYLAIARRLPKVNSKANLMGFNNTIIDYKREDRDTILACLEIPDYIECSVRKTVAVVGIEK